MEGDQELKHMCKFCSKSFPCGRSLGGHMRSHVTTANLSIDEKEKKLSSSSLNNNDSEAANTNAGYGLRENPRKTWRISDYSSEETLVFDKFCKECGRGFHSWKALFGHMKCHSEKERISNNNSLEDQDSWTNNATNTQKMVMDSQSDNEATAPSKRRRSKRRTRYTVAATTSSFVANPSSSSLSEVEQEQEEVAMSLMMLSRDMSPWSGLHSVAESSDNNSACFEARSSVRTNLVTKFESNNKFSTPSSNISKLIRQSDDNKLEVGNLASQNPNSKGKKSSELLANEGPENKFRMNKGGVSKKGFIKNELEYVSALEDSEGELGRNRVNGTESVLSKSATNANKYSSIKTKLLGSELKSNYSLKNWMDKASEAESSKNSHKRGKFECTTCNKIFHSYQALGGHRASHKKIKGCFASKNESSENSIETELSPDTATESKLMKNNSDNEYHHNEVDKVTGSKKSKVHECPICLKVFPSGQALGGHKRSHMVGGGSESRNFQTVLPEIRNFLDLNLPAATEEESNSNADSNRPWWIVEDNHKQEALVGLIS